MINFENGIYEYNSLERTLDVEKFVKIYKVISINESLKQKIDKIFNDNNINAQSNIYSIFESDRIESEFCISNGKSSINIIIHFARLEDEYYIIRIVAQSINIEIKRYLIDQIDSFDFLLKSIIKYYSISYLKESVSGKFFLYDKLNSDETIKFLNMYKQVNLSNRVLNYFNNILKNDKEIFNLSIERYNSGDSPNDIEIKFLAKQIDTSWGGLNPPILVNKYSIIILEFEDEYIAISANCDKNSTGKILRDIFYIIDISDDMSRIDMAINNILMLFHNDKRRRILQTEYYDKFEEKSEFNLSIKDHIKFLKKIPKDYKTIALSYIKTYTKAKNGRISGLNLHDDIIKKANSYGLSTGFDMGIDKNGYYIHTHRSRSKSHKNPSDITIEEIKFIDSTG